MCGRFARLLGFRLVPVVKFKISPNRRVEIGHVQVNAELKTCHVTVYACMDCPHQPHLYLLFLDVRRFTVSDVYWVGGGL